MAQAQVGNIHGYAAVGNSGFLGNISADGTNTVTIDDTVGVPVGANIDLVNKNTGAVLASNRQVTGLTSAGVLTYGGADVVAVPGTTVVVLTGTTTNTGYSNLNGGSAPGEGFTMGGEGLTVDRARTRLKAINALTYSDTELDKMTLNDMRYALRLIEAPGSVT
jgi:hypothetical protein